MLSAFDDLICNYDLYHMYECKQVMTLKENQISKTQSLIVQFPGIMCNMPRKIYRPIFAHTYVNVYLLVLTNNLPYHNVVYILL